MYDQYNFLEIFFSLRIIPTFDIRYFPYVSALQFLPVKCTILLNRFFFHSSPCNRYVINDLFHIYTQYMLERKLRNLPRKFFSFNYHI